jgi:hypothetical protein
MALSARAKENGDEIAPAAPHLEKESGGGIAPAAADFIPRGEEDYSLEARSRRAAPRMSPSEAPESDEPNCCDGFLLFGHFQRLDRQR